MLRLTNTVVCLALTFATIASADPSPPAPDAVYAAGAEPGVVEVTWLPARTVDAYLYNVYGISAAGQQLLAEKIPGTSIAVPSGYSTYAVSAVDPISEAQSALTYASGMTCIRINLNTFPFVFVDDCSVGGLRLQTLDEGALP